MRTQSTQLSKLTGTAGDAVVCSWYAMGTSGLSYLGSKETVISSLHTSALFTRPAARNPEDTQEGADL